jgi:aspartate kinase
MLLSVGERISMALLSMAMHIHGIKAISFTGSQSGIITTASHAGARIIEVRPYRIQDELCAGRVVIVAGYQGVSYKREITTLGRGGSDTTAVALAAALGAEACEIYSDVDGVFTSDPRVVASANKLESITYEEMQEMARLGAKVLNADAVEFARRKGIALYARSTHQPDSRGTRIHHGGNLKRVDGFEDICAEAERALGVVAVSAIKNGLWLQVDGLSPQLLSGFAGALASQDTPVCTMDFAAGSARALLMTADLHDADSLVESLSTTFGGALQVNKDVALVSAIGTGVGRRPRAMARALRALRDAEITPHFSQSAGASISLAIPLASADEATRVLHRALVEESPEDE